jgi:putative membrane protein
VRTVLRIFIRDAIRLLRNPVAIVITLGVAIIPSLYAWFNIVANWDPYSNTGNIKVAVANADEGYDSDLAAHLDAGGQVVKNLKKNDDLGWTFVNRTAAIEGVRSGEYYAAIVIPKDFSRSLITSIDGTSKRASLDYYVNEKKNAIAPKVTDTGASTIEEQIDSTFISTVSDVVVKKITDTAGGIDSSTERAKASVAADLNTTISNINHVRSTLDGVSNTMQQARQNIVASQQESNTLAAQITAAQRSLGNTQSALKQARSSSLTFSNSLLTGLNGGASGLAGIAVDANSLSGNVITSFNEAGRTVDQVTSSIGGVVDANAQAITKLQTALDESGLDKDDPAYQAIEERIQDLQQANKTQQQQLSDFKSSSSTIIDSGKSTATSLSKAVSDSTNSGIAAFNDAGSTLSGTIVPGLLNSMDGFSAMTGTLSGTLTGLSSTVAQSKSLMGQLIGTIDETRSTMASTSAALSSVNTGLISVRDDVAALGSSALMQKISKALDLDSQGIGAFMASPVNLSTRTVYPIKNYGSAVTPFYTNLALWVGGFVIIAIYKLEVDREGLKRMHTIQAYLGRGLLLSVIGIMQALIVTIGDLVIGVQNEHPALFVLAGVFISLVYVNIIYALATSMRHIGKAIAVIVLILQIPGSSGMYPIELMPQFFRNLSPWLPFTYGINAMRETIGGMYHSHYWGNMLALFWYLPLALFIGIVGRRVLTNLNAMFDRRLAATDLLITEQSQGTHDLIGVNSLIRAAASTQEYRKRITQRAHRFLAMYPGLVRTGLVMVVVLPIIFLVLLFSVEAKIVMLILWIVSIILIDFYLIVIEYLRDSFVRQLGYSGPGVEGITAEAEVGIAEHGQDEHGQDEHVQHEHSADGHGEPPASSTKQGGQG